MAGEKKTAPLGAQIAEKLLDLLSSDDDFREDFKRNPAAALESIGYRDENAGAKAALQPTGTLAAPFSACSVTKLASKEQFAAAKDQLKDDLVRGLAYNTPTFEAETLERRTRK